MKFDLSNFGFILRMLKSSNNWTVVVVAVVLNYLGVDSATIGKYVSLLAGVSIAGGRLEDAMQKLNKGKVK